MSPIDLSHQNPYKCRSDVRKIRQLRLLIVPPFVVCFTQCIATASFSCHNPCFTYSVKVYASSGTMKDTRLLAGERGIIHILARAKMRNCAFDDNVSTQTVLPWPCKTGHAWLAMYAWPFQGLFTSLIYRCRFVGDNVLSPKHLKSLQTVKKWLCSHSPSPPLHMAMQFCTALESCGSPCTPFSRKICKAFI